MLTIRLDGQLEQRLKDAATTAGAEPQVVVERLLDQSLPGADHTPDTATLALLSDWEREHATTDPAELRRREEEGQALIDALARNRIESEGPDARKLKP